MERERERERERVRIAFGYPSVPSVTVLFLLKCRMRTCVFDHLISRNMQVR